MTHPLRGRLVAAFLLVPAVVQFTACSDSDKKDDGKDENLASRKDPGGLAQTPEFRPPTPDVWTEDLLHEAILAANPEYKNNGQFRINEEGQPVAISLAQTGVSNIEMLAGLPLMALDLVQCPVTSIAPLAGMPLVELYLERSSVTDLSSLKGNTTLKKLYLSETPVKDLSPLKGLPIEELNMVGCASASDIAGLEGMPLRMLWCSKMPFADVTPLAKSPLVSLTLHDTKVENLQPLGDVKTLQRLHIGGTPVKDLTPIAKLPLTRLVFTPSNIEKGIDAIRQIPSMQQLAVDFENDMNTLMPPPAFWAKYDAGEFK